MITRIIFSGFYKGEDGEIGLREARYATETCQASGLTGVSFYNEGVFLNILEGGENEANIFVDAFKEDQRLSGMQIMINDKIERRDFDDFRVGYQHADFSEEVPNAFKLNKKSFEDLFLKNSSTEVDAFIRSFARVNGIMD